ncbi:MAG TPA: ABC transporter substrate-binding protein, partial [Terriglobia bacterium]|nr:ABC transporter substrate-binding protein [Terriglobia bacterium]
MLLLLLLLALAPHRIVSVAPGITEILFALGAGDQVVGVTTYCNYPETAKAKPKIGGFTTPNVEAIL